MELKNRILEIMEKSGLTPSEFADKIEVQRSAISHITSGRNKPSLEFLIKIKSTFPEIDSDWLVFGIEKEPQTEENFSSDEKSEKTEDSYPTLFELFDTDDKIEKLDTENIPQEINTTKKENSNQKKMIRALLFFDDGTFEEFVSGK